MDDQEEFELITAFRDKDLDCIAEKAIPVFTKREKEIHAIHTRIDNHVESLEEKFDEIMVHISNNNSQLTELHVHLDQHMKDEEDHFNKVYQAFPNKDVRGHHDAHIYFIEADRKRKEFTQKVVSQVIAVITTAAILGLGSAVWFYFIEKINQGNVAP